MHLPKADINSTTLSRQCHAVFHYFLSDNSKQDAENTNSHSKRLISFLKDKRLITASLSTIWENTDVCAKKHIYAYTLYLMSVMSQCYSIIIDRGISAPGHGKYVVDGLNDVDKTYIYQFMFNVQIPGSNRFYSQMKI